MNEGDVNAKLRDTLWPRLQSLSRHCHGVGNRVQIAKELSARVEQKLLVVLRQNDVRVTERLLEGIVDQVWATFLYERDQLSSDGNKTTCYLDYLFSMDADRCPGSVTPLILGRIRRRLRLSARWKPDNNSNHKEQCGQELFCEIRDHLIQTLNSRRMDPNKEPIHDFTRYVEGAMRNFINNHIRRVKPNWTKLKGDLVNLLPECLSHDPYCNYNALVRWRDGQEWVCGSPLWLETRLAPADQELLDNAKESLRTEHARDGLSNWLLSREARVVALGDLVSATFKRVGRPIVLDPLVTLIADLWCIEDGPGQTPRRPIYDTDLAPQEDDQSERARVNSYQEVPDSRVNVEEEVVQRAALRDNLRLRWQETRQLTPLQCIAHLLHSEDEIPQLLRFGIATIPDIAEVMKIPAQELEDLLNELPIKDVRIAELCDRWHPSNRRIGMSRKQAQQRVISLRNSARKRLGQMD